MNVIQFLKTPMIMPLYTMIIIVSLGVLIVALEFDEMIVFDDTERFDIWLTELFPTPQSMKDAINSGYLDYNQLSDRMKDMMDSMD